MKTRRKKLVKNVFIFIAMFMIVGMYIVPVTSNAGQVAKGWGFAFNYDGQERYTNPEAKNTTSSVRMYCEYSDCYYSYYYAKVYSEKDGSTRDAAHGLQYSFSEGETKDMSNWVVENGYDRACIRLTGENIDTEYGTCFGGFWWPDILD